MQPIARGIVLLASIAQPAYAADLQRGPYLQTLTPTGIIIRWRTDEPTDAIVRYGTATNTLFNSSAGSAVGTDHEVILNGLTPATRYYYSIGDSVETFAGGDSSFTFQAAPTPDTAQATRIWIIGDSGTANRNAAAVRDGFKAFTGNRNADIWLMLGDNAYNSGTDSEYQAAVFDMYPVLLRQIPLWPTYGNHDGVSADSNTQSGVYYDIFSLPTNAEAGGLASGTEAYYSFDYGNVHFVSLDSSESDRSIGGAMLTWLNNDLATAAKEWVIAYWHHPPYSKGSHDSDTEGQLIDMRTRALPILESYGVDLVLTGHSHSYERSFFMDSHYGTSDTFDTSMLVDDGSGRENDTGVYTKITSGAPNQGAVYAVAGSSGKRDGGVFDHPAMYISLQTLGSMMLDISGHRLDAVFIDVSGSVRDYFSISKGEGQNINDPPMFTSRAVTNATEDVLYIYNVTSMDPDVGDTLTITAPTLPSWLALTDNGDGTATLMGTPTDAGLGDHVIALAVTDTSDATATQNFTITVENVNDAPTFTSVAVTDITEGQEYSYQIVVVDPDLDAVTITAPTLPAWLTFTFRDNGTATLTSTPTGTEVGAHAVALQAQDPLGLTASQQFTVTVTAAVDGPVITLNGTTRATVQQGGTFNDPGATASDPQDGDLTFRIVATGLPNTAAAGTFTVTYSVQDTAGNSAQVQRTVIVQAPSGGGSTSLVGVFALFLLTLVSVGRRYCRASIGQQNIGQ